MLKSIIFSEKSDHCSKEIKDKTKSNDFYSQFPLRGSPAWHLTPGAEMVSLFPVMDSLSSNLICSCSTAGSRHHSLTQGLLSRSRPRHLFCDRTWWHLVIADAMEMVVGKVGCHQNLVTELQRQKCIFLPTTLTQPAATISVVRGILRIKIKQTCSIEVLVCNPTAPQSKQLFMFMPRVSVMCRRSKSSQSLLDGCWLFQIAVQKFQIEIGSVH